MAEQVNILATGRDFELVENTKRNTYEIRALIDLAGVWSTVYKTKFADVGLQVMAGLRRAERTGPVTGELCEDIARKYHTRVSNGRSTLVARIAWNDGYTDALSDVRVLIGRIQDELGDSDDLLELLERIEELSKGPTLDEVGELIAQDARGES